MTVIRSFPPVADKKSCALILGSMPGIKSLAENQYYAHPQNQFWRIMEAITATPRDAAYCARIKGLLAARIAMWDVLESCVREGSLDASIREGKPHDFVRFFAAHPRITHVFFNGGHSEQVFRRQILPLIDAEKFEFARLPSTSPAHAGMSFEKKRSIWKKALNAALVT